MTPSEAATATFVAVVWGLSFIAIKFGVEDAPPFLLTALRFFFAAIPLVFFVKPPRGDWRLVALYGLLIGVGQFGLLFLGVREGIPVGLSSLVIQMQVVFTIALAAALFAERPSAWQALGSAIAVAGIAVIAAARWGQASFTPFALTLGAAVCWSAGNIVGKRIGRVDPVAFMAWSSLIVPAPMLALSFTVEPGRTAAALLHPGLRLAACVAFLAYGGTVLGFGLWARLLARRSAAAVTPFALIVPVVGMVAAALVFKEGTSAAEASGALVVMIGLAVNVFGARTAGAWSRAGRPIRRV